MKLETVYKPYNFRTMVVQKPVRAIPKTKVRKNLKSSSDNGEEEVKELAGPREAVALEVLHTMFMKRVAQKSNFVAFQSKKNFVDKNILQQGVDITMKECFRNPEEKEVTETESDSEYNSDE